MRRAGGERIVYPLCRCLVYNESRGAESGERGRVAVHVGLNQYLTTGNSGVNCGLHRMARPTLNPTPRSLQEWMERESTNGLELLKLVKAKTGRVISPTMLSFILRGARRCSVLNADALNRATGVPFDTLREWPKVSRYTKLYGRRSSRVA